MARIEGLGPQVSASPSSPAPFRAWFLARRRIELEFRVLHLLASAAVLILILAGGRWLGTPPASHGPAPVFVQFRLHAADATRVELAGSFSQWRAEHALHQVSPGVWVVTVPLESGVHDYSFLIDGTRWTVDPYAPAVDDGFGGAANRLSLLAPEQQL